MITIISIFAILALASIGYVIWIISIEGNRSKNQTPVTLTADPTPDLTSDAFLKKFELEDNKPQKIEVSPVPKLTPTDQTKLSKEEETLINEEIHATADLHELKEKYNRLERLFQEKSNELERVQHELNAEQRTKKEFNKVKDILEKEIKDIKDTAKEYKTELIAVQKENELRKNQILALEAKIAQMSSLHTEEKITLKPLNNNPAETNA
ncbi:MAG: hypothetical protein HQL25_04565 [Candidatus Omnitrophica bacterium]|nr:hypothetical protein [Candidatus Omnitrophota bacterium]